MATLARRSALTLVGAVALLTALGFLTAALWAALVRVLATSWAPVWASIITAAIYLIAGLVCLLFAREPPAPTEPQPAPDAPMERVVKAFLDGIAAGRSVSGARRSGQGR